MRKRQIQLQVLHVKGHELQAAVWLKLHPRRLGVESEQLRADTKSLFFFLLLCALVLVWRMWSVGIINSLALAYPLSPMTPDRITKRKAAEQEEYVAAPARAGAYWSEDVWGRRLTCPITHQLFADPVMASDGFLYERAALERWFAARRTSPLTNAPIDGVFHAVPTVRAEVDAFLSSMSLERRRVWRRWSRSAAFQATLDALEPALIVAAERAPVAWRRLMHEQRNEWTAWIAPPPEGERVEGAALAPPGTAAAQRARRHGWTEEDLANVWHRLPELAAEVAAAAEEVDEEDDTATTTIGMSRLVYRATQRLMEYVRLTCAGYVMACATAYRCAETGAWAAATAVVQHAEALDANILVRMMAASFADSRSGWRLIRVLCDRALDGEGGVSANDAANDDGSSSGRDDDDGSTVSVVSARSEEDQRRVLVVEDGEEDDVDDDDDDAYSITGGDGGEDSSGGDTGDGDMVDGSSNSSFAAPPPSVHAPPMSLLGSRSGVTQSAENRAFRDAMALVDRCGAGLFSTDDDGRDGYGTRRGRDRYPRGSW